MLAAARASTLTDVSLTGCFNRANCECEAAFSSDALRIVYSPVSSAFGEDWQGRFSPNEPDLSSKEAEGVRKAAQKN